MQANGSVRVHWFLVLVVLAPVWAQAQLLGVQDWTLANGAPLHAAFWGIYQHRGVEFSFMGQPGNRYRALSPAELSEETRSRIVGELRKAAKEAQDELLKGMQCRDWFDRDGKLYCRGTFVDMSVRSRFDGYLEFRCPTHGTVDVRLESGETKELSQINVLSIRDQLYLEGCLDLWAARHADLKLPELVKAEYALFDRLKGLLHKRLRKQKEALEKLARQPQDTPPRLFTFPAPPVPELETLMRLVWATANCYGQKWQPDEVRDTICRQLIQTPYYGTCSAQLRSARMKFLKSLPTRRGPLLKNERLTSKYLIEMDGQTQTAQRLPPKPEEGAMYYQGVLAWRSSRDAKWGTVVKCEADWIRLFWDKEKGEWVMGEPKERAACDRQFREGLEKRQKELLEQMLADKETAERIVSRSLLPKNADKLGEILMELFAKNLEYRRIAQFLADPLPDTWPEAPVYTRPKGLIEIPRY